MSLLAEAEIVNQAKAGDQHAFRKLVTAYQGFVYSIAYRFTTNQEEAEDLVQECFVKFWKNLDKYNPEFKLKPWIGKMITNLSLDFVKSARSKNDKRKLEMNENLSVADSRHSESDVHATELHETILRLAEKLTPKQRAAFILRDLEMMEVSEVCDILNISATNLKSNLYYARLNIKEGLLKYYKNSVL